MLILGNYLIGIGVYPIGFLQDFLQKRAGKEISGDPREILPVYDAYDYPDTSKFWKEHLKTDPVHLEPYYHWRRDGFVGKDTNVSPDGVRRTVRIGNNVIGMKKIFMFGGSTLWGTGVKDEHTIPSFLQYIIGEDYEG